MRICLVGGIFSNPDALSSHSRIAPETVLAHGLQGRGHEVETFSHAGFRLSKGFDIIHIHHLGIASVIMAASRSETPFVFTSHNGMIHAGFETSRMQLKAFAFVTRRCDALVALSPAEESFLRKWKSKEAAIMTIPNGIPSEVFFPNQVVKHQEDYIKMLYVGQLIPVKGLEYLFDALASMTDVPNWKLLLVYHNNELEQKLREQAIRLSIADRVEFIGKLSPQELAPLYRSSDFLVLPSLGEALPSVVTEAMLSGIPVVATGITGIPDQLSQYGCLCKPRDSQSLADAIRQMINELPKYRNMTHEISEYARDRFSIRRMIDQHLELYTGLLSNRAFPRHSVLVDSCVGLSARYYRWLRSKSPRQS